jgi:triacylglycerol lipase
MRTLPALITASLAALVLTAPAHAADPPLTVPTAKLAANVHCDAAVRGAKVTPLMVVTGTGASGSEAYAIGKAPLVKFGHPVCFVDFPAFTTGDIQVAVQYLVYGLRVEYARAGRPIAVLGISQGGLLPRVALDYWKSLRSKVSDVVAAAGPQHGTNLARCSAAQPCSPAGWQQRAGSNFLKAVNSQPDETPGPTAWTTTRSVNDETVEPQTGKHPTSSLQGATNILIQDVCPGRKVSHIGTVLDSVTFAALADAIAHRGPAKVSRLPKDVCAHPYAPGFDETNGAAIIKGAGTLTNGGRKVPTVKKEPVVRALFKMKVF